MTLLTPILLKPPLDLADLAGVAMQFTVPARRDTGILSKRVGRGRLPLAGSAQAEGVAVVC
mgnify:FL=1